MLFLLICSIMYKQYVLVFYANRLRILCETKYVFETALWRRRYFYSKKWSKNESSILKRICHLWTLKKCSTQLRDPSYGVLRIRGIRTACNADAEKNLRVRANKNKYIIQINLLTSAGTSRSVVALTISYFVEAFRLWKKRVHR